MATDESWHARLEVLGGFIRSQRRLANLSLRDLAQRTDISNPYLSQIERGLHEPSVRVLKAIADAHGASIALDANPAGQGLAVTVSFPSARRTSS